MLAALTLSIAICAATRDNLFFGSWFLQDITALDRELCSSVIFTFSVHDLNSMNEEFKSSLQQATVQVGSTLSSFHSQLKTS